MYVPPANPWLAVSELLHWRFRGPDSVIVMLGRADGSYTAPYWQCPSPFQGSPPRAVAAPNTATVASATAATPTARSLGCGICVLLREAYVGCSDLYHGHPSVVNG